MVDFCNYFEQVLLYLRLFSVLIGFEVASQNTIEKKYKIENNVIGNNG